MIYGYCRVSTRGQASDGNSLDDQTKRRIRVRSRGMCSTGCAVCAMMGIRSWYVSLTGSAVR